MNTQESDSAPHSLHPSIVTAFDQGDFKVARKLLDEIDVPSCDDERIKTIQNAVAFDRAFIGVAISMAVVWIGSFLYVL